MKDPAPAIAKTLDGLDYLSPFDTGHELVDYVLRFWPHLTTCEARRAVAIFLELRRADYAFALSRAQD